VKGDLEKHFPGANFSFGQPIIDQVMEIVTGSAADLAISIVGDSLEMMRKKADSIAVIVKSTQGAEAVNIEQEGPQEQISIKFNRENAARFGINVSDIQTMIEAAIGGQAIGILYDGAKRYDIMIRYLPESRNTIDRVRQLLVPSMSGALVPINQLATVEYIEGQTNIYRINGKRMITVRTNIRNRDQGSFVKEASAKINKRIKVPKGYEIIYGGQYENLERAGKQLSVTIPLTIVVVFLFLFMLYKNMTSTLITMSCILFALGGGIVALLMRGYHFNVSAGVGFVSIFGISVMAGVLLVSSFNRLNFNSQEELLSGVQHTSAEQLKALLSILVVAIVGLVPAAISKGIGSDVQRPLATVIIGGLTSTLIFAPIVIPALYYIVFKRKLPEKAEKI
jgi:cobalt-zinc-cadmium resistance protein CzcA